MVEFDPATNNSISWFVDLPFPTSSPHRHLSLLHKGVVNSPTFLAESHRNHKNLVV